jgi:chromate reductase, NAD(P)H dehydrogenase (quinone)
MTINVLGLSGSLRKASYNTALLRAAQELAPLGMRITIYDLSEIMIYNEDLRGDGYPPPVEAFRSAVNAADAVIMASPEYNRSVPAVLKNAIDWASRKPNQPFSQKPLAIMGVSNGALGAAFANYHLRQIFVHMDARLLNGAEVMIGGAKEKFDQHGTLTHEPTRAFVRAHLERLALLVKEVRAATVAQAVETTRE